MCPWLCLVLSLSWTSFLVSSQGKFIYFVTLVLLGAFFVMNSFLVASLGKFISLVSLVILVVLFVINVSYHGVAYYFTWCFLCHEPYSGCPLWVSLFALFLWLLLGGIFVMNLYFVPLLGKVYCGFARYNLWHEPHSWCPLWVSLFSLFYGCTLCILLYLVTFFVIDLFH